MNANHTRTNRKRPERKHLRETQRMKKELMKARKEEPKIK